MLVAVGEVIHHSCCCQLPSSEFLHSPGHPSFSFGGRGSFSFLWLVMAQNTQKNILNENLPQFDVSCKGIQARLASDEALPPRLIPPHPPPHPDPPLRSLENAVLSTFLTSFLFINPKHFYQGLPSKKMNLVFNANKYI